VGKTFLLEGWGGLWKKGEKVEGSNCGKKGEKFRGIGSGRGRKLGHTGGAQWGRVLIEGGSPQTK